MMPAPLLDVPSTITIFTAPKPFTNPHIAAIQRNAIQSWKHLPDVDVILIGEETGMADAATHLGVKHIPNVARNAAGTPLVSSIFELARQNSSSPLLAYVNADVMLLPDFVEISHLVSTQVEALPPSGSSDGGGRGFLLIGQRWDLDIRQELDFTPGWVERLTAEVKLRGRLHPPAGSDYFVFPRNCFTQMPKFAIGRAGWDNWMIFSARWQRWPAVDTSGAINVIHQDHDYSHLPGGQPHYRLPETFENIRLAGGRRAIYHLEDADYCIENGRLRPIPSHGKKLWREVEAWPLNRLHSFLLAELFYAFFHPRKAWGEWRGRLAYKLISSPQRHKKHKDKNAS